jgi:hypothetical protein
MNDQRPTDRLLAAWLELEAPVSAPDDLRTDIHRATARIRPRPAWLARLGGHHMDVITGGARRRDTRLLPLLALLGLLLAAALALYVGSQRPPTENPLADVATPTPAVKPDATEARPALLSYADVALSMPYPIRQVQLGLSGNYVGTAGPDTNELLRSIYRVDTGLNRTTLLIDDIPAGPSDHLAFAASGGVILIGHGEGNRALRYDAKSGEFLGEIAVGTGPLEPLMAGGAIWFPNFGEGSVTGIDPSTGTVVATVSIPQFNGRGPLSLAVGDHSDRFWAVSPSSNTLVGIRSESGAVEDEATLPGESYCGVAGLTHRYWVVSCDGSGSVEVLPDTYVSSRVPVTFTVAPGALAPVFEHNNRVWFPTEDRSNPQWTTTLVPVDPESLAVGAPFDLGARVGVVRIGSGVWLISGTDLYRLNLDALPSDPLRLESPPSN